MGLEVVRGVGICEHALGLDCFPSWFGRWWHTLSGVRN